MRGRRFKIIVAGVLVISATAAAFFLNPTRPPGVIKFVKLERIRGEDREYLEATLVLTNVCHRPICYWGYSLSQPVVQQLHQFNGDWRAQSPGPWCGTGLQRQALLPHQSVTLEAWIDENKPTRIALEYSTRRGGEGLVSKLPDWLLYRFPILIKQKTIVSDEIDPRAFPEVPLRSEPTDEARLNRWALLEKSASSGDRDSQFELGELGWTDQNPRPQLRPGLEFYEMAATNGHPRAAYNLGLIYDYVMADTTNAIKWYRHAKDLGCEEAKVGLRELGAR